MIADWVGQKPLSMPADEFPGLVLGFITFLMAVIRHHDYNNLEEKRFVFGS